MGTQASARVELLTAEVRVLMVGSRQVTLSVARQLDWVPLVALEPFGRVRLAGGDETTVIGSRIASGTLALARFDPLFSTVMVVMPAQLDRPIKVCAAWEPEEEYTRGDVFHGSCYSLLLNGDEFWVHKNAVKRCARHGPRRNGPWSAELKGYEEVGGEEGECESWKSQGQDDEIEQRMIAHAHAYECHMRAAELPLIVLAGLR